MTYSTFVHRCKASNKYHLYGGNTHPPYLAHGRRTQLPDSTLHPPHLHSFLVLKNRCRCFKNVCRLLSHILIFCRFNRQYLVKSSCETVSNSNQLNVKCCVQRVVRLIETISMLVVMYRKNRLWIVYCPNCLSQHCCKAPFTARHHEKQASQKNAKRGTFAYLRTR
jgi:hypothetical protein